MKTKIKKAVKRIKAVSKGLKEKGIKVKSHINAEVQRLINKGRRMSLPNTESHKIYLLHKKGIFKKGKTYVVKNLPNFDNKNLCLDGQLTLNNLGYKLSNRVYDKTRNNTKSKKKILSFTIVK